MWMLNIAAALLAALPADIPGETTGEPDQPVVRIKMMILEFTDDFDPEGVYRWNRPEMSTLDAKGISLPSAEPGSPAKSPARETASAPSSGQSARPDVSSASEPTGAKFKFQTPHHTIYVVDGDFQIKSGGLYGESDKPPPWNVLAAPTILVHVGQQASVTIGREVPYMVKREDGSLIIKQSPELIEGIVIQAKVESARWRMVTFEDIRLKLSRIAQRQPIEGVPFGVGRPILASQEHSLSLRLADGAGAAINLPQPNEGDPLIEVFLAVKIVNQE